jgi:hypothetical protein
MQHRPIHVDIHGKDHEYQHQGDHHQQGAEAAHAVRELGLGWPHLAAAAAARWG